MSTQLVLLVEDDDLVRDYAERALRSAGIEVIACHSAEDALQHLHRTDIGMVLTDVRMPKVDGLEFARRVRGARATLPIRFMSGYAESVGRAELEQLSGAPLLAKPFRRRDLLEYVQSALPARD